MGKRALHQNGQLDSENRAILTQLIGAYILRASEISQVTFQTFSRGQYAGLTSWSLSNQHWRENALSEIRNQASGFLFSSHDISVISHELKLDESAILAILQVKEHN